jgi:hypothetical protein
MGAVYVKSNFAPMQPVFNLFGVITVCALSTGSVCSGPIVATASDPWIVEDEEKSVFRKAIEDALDKTKGVEDTCPVHKIKMTVKVVPIAYGLRFTDFRDFEGFSRDKFPFFREDISGGCCVDNSPEAPTKGKRYVCPECVASWKRFLEDLQAKAAAAQSR